MVIECSSCQARFKLADDKIKETGTKVRCTKCREVFTVFPENPPVIVPPVISPPPVIANEKKIIDEDFFTIEDKTPAAPETSYPAAAVPVSHTDDWNQEAESNLFVDDAGDSDLDAINFDNFETQDFSVTPDKSSKFEFNDDTAFAFEESSLEIGAEQQYKIAASTDERLPAESENDFEADFFSAPSPVSTPKELTQASSIASAEEFTFSEEESLSDFSWGETNISAAEPVASEISQVKDAAPQDTAFDFGSFSFDEAPEPAVSDENHSDTVKTLTESETTIELSVDSESTAAPVSIRPISPEVTQSPAKTPLAKDREGTSSSTRPFRPRSRSRQTQKVSSKSIFKILLLLFLTLGLIYGIINREQIQKEYKNLVSGFIENQVPAETGGQIDLAKLTGGYLLNSQEGELFVIRGEAINEFKGLRSSVLIKGTIYGENGAVLQSQSAYCGNSIKDGSLKKLSFKEIREAMNNELGENLVNLNISVGKAVPFMIVFNKVPKNIKEFAVEVVDSKAGSK